MQQKVLVVGGAGYIGSHMVKYLRQRGYVPVVFDSLVTGYADAVRCAELVEGDLADQTALNALFEAHSFEAVFHFASYIQVGESVQNPAKYYANNVGNTIQLLNTMVAHGVGHFIFSSTAAVYGEPQYTPIDEVHPQCPINPYGRSKWMIEQLLPDYSLAHGLNSVCLRYFNAAGADPAGELGERHEPETHLIPLVLQVAAGRRPAIKVFGSDYPTADGTCIRDYIHVTDLCQAHVLAFEYLQQGGSSDIFNLGNGAGFSVLEVIQMAEKVTGCRIPIVWESGRPGDPAILLANANRAKNRLGWKPELNALETIIRHAWEWECSRLGCSA